MKKNKLHLTYLSEKNMNCIPHPHYDLWEEAKPGSKRGYNIACILTDKQGAKLIRKWIKEYNNEKN